MIFIPFYLYISILLLYYLNNKYKNSKYLNNKVLLIVSICNILYCYLIIYINDINKLNNNISHLFVKGILLAITLIFINYIKVNSLYKFLIIYNILLSSYIIY